MKLRLVLKNGIFTRTRSGLREAVVDLEAAKETEMEYLLKKVKEIAL